ncbi:MAG TPA: hypothetical protein VFH80_25385 [Solirubrobacteraceae bacterium]|nr:hypothetical protein [Solirubrobacteraceae bacterium]
MSDIQAQITTIQGVTKGTTTVDSAKTALNKIKADVQTIQAQFPDLKSSLKQKLQSANAAFKTQVQAVLSSITSAQSLSGAAAALTSAGQTLATAYRQAYATVGC